MKTLTDSLNENEYNNIVLQQETNYEFQKKCLIQFETLSKSEKQVFDLVIQGYSSQEIANIFPFRAIATIETHRNRINRKLNVHNNSEIMLFAIANGLITQSQAINSLIRIQSNGKTYGKKFTNTSTNAM